MSVCDPVSGEYALAGVWWRSGRGEGQIRGRRKQGPHALDPYRAELQSQDWYRAMIEPTSGKLDYANLHLPLVSVLTLRTIVTAVTASSLPHFLHLHSTLPRSPLTRIVVFVLKTSTSLCSEALDSLSDPELELRYIKDTSHIHLQTYTSPVTAVREEDGAEISEDKGKGAEWLGVVLADKIKLSSDVAEEQGGLVLWLDPDREVGNDILKVWEEVAKEGVWVGQAEAGEGGIA